MPLRLCGEKLRLLRELLSSASALASLRALELDPIKTTVLTVNASYSVTDFTISDDGKYVAFRGASTERYKRNITQESLYADLYLLETSSGEIERLTNNQEVGEGMPSFSPDSRWIAFSGPDDLVNYSMSNRRVYLREAAAHGAPFKKMGASFDGDVTTGFWSEDGSTIYFNQGVRATNQLMALDVRRNTVRQITSEQASLSVDRDDTGVLLIDYADGTTPPTIFTVPAVDRSPRVPRGRS